MNPMGRIRTWEQIKINRKEWYGISGLDVVRVWCVCLENVCVLVCTCVNAVREYSYKLVSQH